MTRNRPSTSAVRRAFVAGRIKKVDIGAREAKATFDTWLEEHDRQVAERAWDEGFRVSQNEFIPFAANPYRKDPS